MRCCLALFLPFTVNAFVANRRGGERRVSFSSSISTTSSWSSKSWRLFDSKERIKSAGAGITLDTGYLSVFDPDAEGKLQGTGIAKERIQKGTDYQFLPSTKTSAGAAPPQDVTLLDCQHWLEDIGLPLNFAKPNAPVTAQILGSARLITSDAPGDIQHIVMRLPSGFHYVEGQSLSVIPPGFDAKGKPHKPRLYSIASTRYGDLLDGNTVSLCVRRAEYVDPATGLVDPTKAGVCSNFLCNAAPLTQVSVAGPVGKTMLLPEDPTRDIIMVATGTGVAPFRGFLHRLFMEETVARHIYSGTAWLVLGVPTTGGLLYHDELEAMKQNAMSLSSNLEVDYAISREMFNAQGGKMYVQDMLAQNGDKLFDRLADGAVIYFCGLKMMMPPILECLEKEAIKRGVDWPAFQKKLKDNHQWHVEVY